MRFLDRLDRIQRRLDREQGGPGPMLIRVTGGLPGGIRYASAGDVRLKREPGEPLDVFEGRALDLARELGAAYAVVGGLFFGDDEPECVG